MNATISTNKVHNVLFGLCIFSLKKSDNRLPLYLYDTNIRNDYKYLLNIDTFKRTVTYPIVHYMISNIHLNFNYNLMFEWQHNYKEGDFSKDKVVKKYSRFMNNRINKNKTTTFDQNIVRDQLFTQRINNFKKYVLVLIKENPNINFIFFYPPYSILFFKSMSQKTLQTFVEVKQYINKILLQYPNVKLFDFQNALSIITNLDNYRDRLHYHQKINIWMTEKIKNNEYLLTNDKVTDYNSFKKYIYEYKF